MHCHKVHDLFSELHEATIAPSLRQAVEAHLKDCLDCQADYEGFVSLYGALAALPIVEAPGDLSERISRRLDLETWEAKQSSRPQIGWLRVALASVAATVVIGTVYVSFTSLAGDGITAGPGIPLSSGEPQILMRDGNPVLEVSPSSQTRVQIFENDKPLVDDRVSAGRKAEYLLNRKGDRAAVVWVRVGEREPIVVIVPSGKSSSGAGAFEGTLVRGLEALSEGFGFVFVAYVRESGEVIQRDFTGLDVNDSLRLLLNDTGYRFTSKNGVVEIR